MNVPSHAPPRSSPVEIPDPTIKHPMGLLKPFSPEITPEFLRTNAESEFREYFSSRRFASALKSSMIEQAIQAMQRQKDVLDYLPTPNHRIVHLQWVAYRSMHNTICAWKQEKMKDSAHHTIENSRSLSQ